MKIHEYNEMMAYLTRPAVNRVGFKQGTSKKYKVTNQYGTFYTDKKPGGPSTVELTTEMKERIKIFEEKTGLKYADQSVEKQHRIRAGKWKGTLPSKEKMKTQISVPEDGPPKWPNKKMEADFIKDLRKKIKFPTGKATPEHLRVSALVKKYPISERQLERLTRYYREKLNLTYAKGLASGDVTGKETATKRRNALKKYSDLTAEGWLTGNEQLHKSHMSDLYTRDVRTGTMGYAKAKINMEALDNIDAKMNSLYKKADKLLKDNPKDFAIKMDEINMKGTDLAAQSGGYKKFEAIDPITKKKFVINFSSAAQELDPTDILENKKLKDLKLFDKATIQTLKEASMENISKANMSIKNLLASADTKTIMKVRKALGCMSEGGRVGLQGGGNLLECPMAKFAQDPEGTLNRIGTVVPEARTPIINALKKFGMGTLKWGGRTFIGLTPIFAGMEIADASRKYEEGVPSGQIAMDAFGNWVVPGAGEMYKTYQDRKMMKDIASPQELVAMEKEDDRRYYNMLQEDPLREADYSKKLEETQTTPEEQLELFKLMEKQKATEYWNQQRRKGERAKLAEESTDTFSDFRDYAAASGGRVGYRIGGLIKLYETAKKVYPLLKSGAKEELAKLFNILKKNTVTVKRGESGTTGASGQGFTEYRGKYWNPPEGGFEGAAADARFYSKLGGPEGKPKVLTAELTPEEIIEGKRLRGLDVDDPEIGDIILPESAENKVKIDYLNTIRARIEKILGMAEGGRVGYAKGPKDPTRRLVLKGITAAATLPFINKYFKLGKLLTKAGAYTGPVIQKIKGMPEWFPGLVKRLWNEGEDVTKTVAYKDKQVVKRGTLEGGDDVDLVYQMDTGDVSIQVTPNSRSRFGDYQTKSGAYNKEYSLDYQKGQADEMTKGKKPPDEFGVTELEGRMTPDAADIDWDANYTTVDDAMSDLTEIEAFAKNKTTKQIHKKKGTKPKDVFPDYDPGDPDLYGNIDPDYTGGEF